MTAPPIPASCAHRPTTPAGLVVPFGNVQLAGGGCDFRSHHQSRWLACWKRSLCQVCGGPLRHPMVLLCGPRQLGQLLFDEPAVHPECARYVTTACPMVAGERARYATGPALAERSRGQRCYEPSCDCGGWVAHTDGGLGGDAAHEWYAAYVSGYTLTADLSGEITGALCQPGQVVRVKLVSRPGRGLLTPWETVSGWADGYEAPERLETS